MANVTPPRNGIPIGTARIGGQMVSIDVHPEYLRWFESLTTRVGGVMGASTTDLTLSAFEDAGIEEQKAALFRLADDALTAIPGESLHRRGYRGARSVLDAAFTAAATWSTGWPTCVTTTCRCDRNNAKRFTGTACVHWKTPSRVGCTACR